MSKANQEELAAAILIAAIEKGVLAPDGAIPDVRAASLARLYAIILDGLRDPPPPRLPKAKAK